MKFINIMGPLSDLERVAETYLCKHEIQFEYTIKELHDEKGLTPISLPNPYGEVLKKAENLLKTVSVQDDRNSKNKPPNNMSKEEAFKVIEQADDYLSEVNKSRDSLIEKRSELVRAAENIEPFNGLNFRIGDLQRFRFIKYQFGKMPISSFMQFEAFLYNDPEILFVDGKRDKQYIWGIYFAAGNKREKADSMFSTLHFDAIDISLTEETESMTPAELYSDTMRQISELNDSITEKEKKISDNAAERIDSELILAAYDKLKLLDRCFDLHKYAAKTANNFYILVGWITKRNATALSDELSKDDLAVFIIENDNESILSAPPTKLKNLTPLRPFEFFVRMYGLPSYDEIDPTPFMALTYTVLFGIMFGDIGQGLVLSLLGLFLFLKSKLPLGKILMVIGLSSAFFGLLYGSFFGIEELFDPLWMRPSPESSDILFYAVYFGVFLIFISLIFNLANAIRKKKLKNMLFQANGLAGMLFYGAALGCLLVMINGGSLGLLILLAVVPLLLIALAILRHVKATSVPMRLFETVIEIFEIVLSYFTNTLSFIRVGAFALSHACMMGVVMMLANATHDLSKGNLFVIIAGNVLVMGLEGLIVGIQVLRLEFYEMFSRFYEGTGREFEPVKFI